MTGHSTMSHTDARRIDRWRDRIGLVSWPNACAAAALACLLFVGNPGGAVAQTPGAVWAGCTLDANAVNALKARMPSSGPNGFVQDGAVAFVVIYTMKDNDGQEFRPGPNAGTFTGPVICTNPDADSASSVFRGVGITSVPQDADIPSGSSATAVNTLDAEEVFILRYALANGGTGVAGTVEKVVCHAVNDKTFCYRISPLLP
jgi:hypothetical protein